MVFLQFQLVAVVTSEFDLWTSRTQHFLEEILFVETFFSSWYFRCYMTALGYLDGSLSLTWRMDCNPYFVEHWLRNFRYPPSQTLNRGRVIPALNGVLYSDLLLPYKFLGYGGAIHLRLDVV